MIAWTRSNHNLFDIFFERTGNRQDLGGTSLGLRSVSQRLSLGAEAMLILKYSASLERSVCFSTLGWVLSIRLSSAVVLFRGAGAMVERDLQSGCLALNRNSKLKLLITGAMHSQASLIGPTASLRASPSPPHL
jgi:hypothetical protein